MCDDDDNQDEESDEEDELLSQLLCPIQSTTQECTRSLEQRPRPMDETKFRFGDLEVVLPPAQEVNMAQCVWKGALLTAAFVGGQLEEISAPPTLFASGSEVLEIGCGRGLVGLVAAARGASRVVLTDCDDRVLSLLDRHSSTSSSVVSVAHLLWEQDLWEESIGAEGTPQRHWSDAYRNEDIRALPYGQQFDVVIGCECLYFPSQEAPLAAVLRLEQEVFFFLLISLSSCSCCTGKDFGSQMAWASL